VTLPRGSLKVKLRNLAKFYDLSKIILTKPRFIIEIIAVVKINFKSDLGNIFKTIYSVN
jgi:hypothetical protein